jgi:hypothetical protein
MSSRLEIAREGGDRREAETLEQVTKRAAALIRRNDEVLQKTRRMLALIRAVRAQEAGH